MGLFRRPKSSASRKLERSISFEDEVCALVEENSQLKGFLKKVN
jgi:hypothetical protein